MLRDYLIICPLVFIAGYIDAVAGGGGLVSLPAYMLTGIPVHQCVATNKMSAFMGTSVATAKYDVARPLCFLRENSPRVYYLT